MAISSLLVSLIFHLVSFFLLGDHSQSNIKKQKGQKYIQRQDSKISNFKFHFRKRDTIQHFQGFCSFKYFSKKSVGENKRIKFQKGGMIQTVVLQA